MHHLLAKANTNQLGVLLADVDIGEVWQLSGQNGKGGFTSLSGIISFVFPKILIIGGIVFFIMIVFAGLGMISGAGGDDPHSQEQAKNFLTFSIVGLLIMFGSFWILQIISKVTGGSLGAIGF